MVLPQQARYGLMISDRVATVLGRRSSVGVAWPGLQCGSLVVQCCLRRPSTDPASVGMPCLLGCGLIRFARLCFDVGPSSLTLVLYRTRSYVVFDGVVPPFITHLIEFICY